MAPAPEQDGGHLTTPVSVQDSEQVMAFCWETRDLATNCPFAVLETWELEKCAGGIQRLVLLRPTAVGVVAVAVAEAGPCLAGSFQVVVAAVFAVAAVASSPAVVVPP